MVRQRVERTSDFRMAVTIRTQPIARQARPAKADPSMILQVFIPVPPPNMLRDHSARD
jgi:hypothetical protein